MAGTFLIRGVQAGFLPPEPSDAGCFWNQKGNQKGGRPLSVGLPVPRGKLESHSEGAGVWGGGLRSPAGGR